MCKWHLNICCTTHISKTISNVEYFYYFKPKAVAKICIVEVTLSCSHIMHKLHNNGHVMFDSDLNYILPNVQ